MAARQNKSEIDSDDIFNALERIALGLERKDAVMSEQRRRLVAYHEAGHAILGALVNDYDAVAKISIVPRGPAGGVTIFMPSEERLNSGKVPRIPPEYINVKQRRGHFTRNKKLLAAPGIATRSKDATRGSWPCY